MLKAPWQRVPRYRKFSEEREVRRPSHSAVPSLNRSIPVSSFFFDEDVLIESWTPRFRNGDSYRLNQSKRRSHRAASDTWVESDPGLMPEQKTPVSGAFRLASLMYFCSGQPMHFCFGVDTIAQRNVGVLE